MDFQKKIEGLNIEDALKYTQSIIDAVQDPAIILREDFTVALANRSFYQNFQTTPEKTEGSLIYDLGNGQWDIPKLRELLDEILPKTTSFDAFEIEHDFLHIGRRIMLLNARRVYLQANYTKLIIITIKDITQRRKIEELHKRIVELEARLKKPE